MSVHVFGIRHHGPGCARSLRAALDELQPDAVLVEGPPDADGELAALLDPAMVPPVALLVYEPSSPSNASFYPFTRFSPEWQALRWALERGVHAAFMDLPMAHRLAQRPEEPDTEPSTGEPDAAPSEGAHASSSARPPLDTGAPEEAAARVRVDPIQALAEAAGQADGELWWEQQIEARRDAVGLFEAIAAAMAAVRESAGVLDPHDALREAYMRKVIRATQKAGRARIAVVCGAWHAPALVTMPPAKHDTALLKGLPKTRVACTWIPWTNSRLSYRSGYGAGIDSPGWYAHLWDGPEQATIRWITLAAHLLRARDLDASAASVIEAVRLAEALAALRELSTPGLRELREAIETVLCHGEPAPMALIRDALEIGETLGAVPDTVAAVPLQRDLEAQQKRLRLRPNAEVRHLDLDLRKDFDLDRSRLLHRLDILGIAWGARGDGPRSQGTFRESWDLLWRPELHVALIEANVWGNSIEAASTARLIDRAASADLEALTQQLDAATLAALPAAIDALLAALQAKAALSADVGRMMHALEPLARLVRYGDVRQTRAEAVLPILHGLLERVLVGLPGACASLDHDAAQRMLSGIEATHAAITLLDRPEDLEEWRGALGDLMGRDRVHGLIRGRCSRLALELGALDDAELGRLAALTLSTASDPVDAAAWVEGLLRGTGLLLVHQQAVWTALDAWIRALDRDTFVALLPLVRRGFADFAPAERRMMGQRVKQLGGPARGGRPAAAEPLVPARAVMVLPVLSRILGAERW